MTRTGPAAVLAAALAALSGAPLSTGAQTRSSLQPLRVVENGQTSTEIEGGSGESLSSKLNKSGGVIAPKSDVDPAIGVPAPDPDPNSTPVIPPSRNGGGTAK